MQLAPFAVHRGPATIEGEQREFVAIKTGLPYETSSDLQNAFSEFCKLQGFEQQSVDKILMQARHIADAFGEYGAVPVSEEFFDTGIVPDGFGENVKPTVLVEPAINELKRNGLVVFSPSGDNYPYRRRSHFPTDTRVLIIDKRFLASVELGEIFGSSSAFRRPFNEEISATVLRHESATQQGVYINAGQIAQLGLAMAQLQYRAAGSSQG